MLKLNNVQFNIERKVTKFFFFKLFIVLFFQIIINEQIKIKTLNQTEKTSIKYK